MSATRDEIRDILDDDQGEHDHWSSSAAQNDLVQILTMVADRQMEALRLYSPTPIQEMYHLCRAKELLFSKGNQVGGSMAGFSEDARAATGCDPYNKYPTKDGICVCLGYGEGHIGRVIHKYLFRYGAFEIIRDKDSRMWRTYRPWEPDVQIMGFMGDSDRKDEARPAPPLIPERLIRTIAWKKRAQYVFDLAELTNGWTIYAFNSQGEYEHAQGFPVDLWHIDEDVATEGWVSEAIARLSKREGRLRWTAMPHARTDDIVMMLQRAEEEQHKESPASVVIYAGIDDNPYLPEKTKEENKRIWRTMGEEEYSRRVEGKLIIGSLKMYPQFDERLHNAIVPLSSMEQKAEESGRSFRHPIQKILTERDGEPPRDWCRFLSIDPGYSIAAGVFLAVPPPRYGRFVVAYDELYIPSCTASIFAEHFRKKGIMDPIQEFIFDFHGGKLRSLGSGEVPVEVWEKEFSKRDLTCVARGSRMRPGADDRTYRELKLRENLLVRHEGPERGYPTLLVCVDRCPNFVRELKRFRRKVRRQAGRDIVLDEGNRVNTHAIECVEQAIGYGMPYAPPPAPRELTNRGAEWIMSLVKEVRNLGASRRGPKSNHITLGATGARK